VINFRDYKEKLNYEIFRHCRNHRTKAELRKTSGTIGVIEPKLNYKKKTPDTIKQR